MRQGDTCVANKLIKIGAGQSNCTNGSEIVQEGQDALWMEDVSKSAAQRKKRWVICFVFFSGCFNQTKDVMIMSPDALELGQKSYN